MIRLLAAVDTERGIATDSGIPWTLPDDVTRFHDETRSGLILMGWMTYTEFAAPLHGRVNYVVSRTQEALRRGFRSIGNLGQLHAEHPREDIWVIGGAAVFEQTINQADELVLTQVLSDFHCTKFFPPFVDRFDVIERGPDLHRGTQAFRFETWRRHSEADPRFAASSAESAVR
jgi:dihydrofolate reductase